MEYKEGDVVEVVTKLNKFFGRGELVKLIETTDEGDSWVADDDLYRGVVHKNEIAPYEYEYPKENQELPMTTPEHYSKGGIEPKDFINSHNLNFNLGNVVKYVSRGVHKGTQEQDLRKAIDYLNFEIERINK